MNTATATASANAAPQSFKDVWLISAGHGLTHWYTATFYILLPLIGKEFGLSYTQIGMIMTVQYLAGAISNIPGGMIVDMVGKKGYLMATSLFWVGFPYALMSLVHSFWMLLVCVTLVGIGNNLWHPAAIPTLAYRYPKRKALVLGFHGMGGNVGEALAPFVVGALLGWFSWRTVVVINVIPGLTMSMLILFLLGAFTVNKGRDENAINADSTGHNVKQYLRDFAGLLKNKSLMLVGSSSAMRTMTQAGLMTFLPVYLAYELNYSPFAVGICMTVLQVAGFIAAPLGGHVSDKWGRRQMIMSSMLLSGAMIIGMVLAGRSAWFVLFIALVGFFLYAMRAVLQAMAIEAVPKNLAGAGVGLQFGFTSLGAAISPSVFGLIADHFDIHKAFYFLAGTIVLANLLVFFMPKDNLQPAAHAAG
jgi:FSR family fosmidomycin resistance protein-like MFS transporter